MCLGGGNLCDNSNFFSECFNVQNTFSYGLVRFCLWQIETYWYEAIQITDLGADCYFYRILLRVQSEIIACQPHAMHLPNLSLITLALAALESRRR